VRQISTVGAGNSFPWNNSL